MKKLKPKIRPKTKPFSKKPPSPKKKTVKVKTLPKPKPKVVVKPKKPTKPKVVAVAKIETPPPQVVAKEERQELFVIFYSQSSAHWNFTDSARQMGIPVKTLEKWMTDPIFSNRIREAQNRKADNVLQSAYSLAIHGDTRAQALFLQYNSKKSGNDPKQPYIPPAVVEILRGVKEGTISVRDGIYDCQMLGYEVPEAIKLELHAATALAGALAGKTDEDKPMSIEELERRADLAWEKAAREKDDWLPKRRVDVEGMRTDVEQQMKGRDAVSTAQDDDDDGE